MGVHRWRVAEQCGQVGLSRRGREQVVAAYHLIDSGGGVVDHHGQVVGRHPVTAAQHEVVDHAGEFTVQQIGHGELADVGTQSHGRRASAGVLGFPLGRSEFAAGPRIGAFGCVRCPRCLKDFSSAAETFVDQSAVDEVVDHRVVTVGVCRLPLWLLIPGHPDRGEVGQLAVGDVVVGAVVEVFHPDQEPPSR